ncbi:MAG TPA: DUF3048 domain-containing protein [Candidatus Saccharimonadales bacterium]|nr:DUF3048 domain-containing protein [Candidatus Saccharimonadales bacterium]
MEPRRPVVYKPHNEPEVDFEINEASPEPASEISPDKTMKKSFKNKFRPKLPQTKKGWAVVAVIVVLILGLVLYFASSGTPPKKKNVIAVLRTKTVPKSDLVPSTLSGLPVAPSVNKIPVTGVMIENSVQARPQSGLSSAGVVFEALAEGGITRFLALYQDTAPSNVGPVRSARPYFVSWDMGFDAAYAHVGGSPDGLNDISAWGTKDLNEFYNGAFYHRISSRVAPHNVYTSIANLNQLEANKGYTSTNFTGFPRKTATPAAKPSVSTINITMSGPDYNVSYAYNPKTNSYMRSEGGAPHIDANNNQQISPTVVVAIVVPETQGALDASGAYYSDYNVLSSGTAYVFQDGILTTGQWAKTSNSSQITFTTSGGQPLKFDPGQTWITAITSPSQLTYGQ